ncbi:MAG: MFS transporter [Paracoccaceae bacterium]
MIRTPYFRAYGFWHWGEGLQTVLFTWYMTFHADLTASQIGFYQALVLSPFLVLTIAGGMLTDRIGAGVCYLISTVLFGVLLIGYGVVDHHFGFVPWLFFAYCIGAGVLSAISNPAIDTFIPEASPRRAQENALLAANVHNVSKLSGNITGLALPVVHALGGFVANGILMLLSVVFLRKHMHKNPRSRQTEIEMRDASLARVWRHYRDCPENLDILLSSALLGFLVIPVGYILIPLTLREKFPEFGDQIALINISSWIGAIVVTLAVARVSSRIGHPGRVSLLVWGAYAGLLALVPYVPGFAWLCLLVGVMGTVKLSKGMVYGKYIRNCPNDMSGVVIAVEQTAFWGLATIGAFGMGNLVDGVGLQVAIHGSALAIGVGVLLLALRGRLARLEPAV